MGFFSSAIQLSYSATGDLLVHYSPHYLGSIPLFILGIPLAWACASLIKDTGLRPMSLVYMLGFLPLVFAFYMATGSYTLDFSKQRGDLVATNWVFFIKSVHTYPLSSVAGAEVQEDDGNSHMLYIEFKSGNRMPTGAGWMPGRGYFQAANAVNQFLGQNQSGSTASSVTGAAAADADRLRRQLLEATEKKMQSAQQQPSGGNDSKSAAPDATHP